MGLAQVQQDTSRDGMWRPTKTRVTKTMTRGITREVKSDGIWKMPATLRNGRGTASGWGPWIEEEMGGHDGGSLGMQEKIDYY